MAGLIKRENLFWIYRGLVLAAALAVLVSFYLPWWSTQATASTEGSFSIQIFGYGLKHNMVELRQYIMADETPAFQMALAWAYAGVSALLALGSAWLKGIKGRLLLGVTGAGYLAYAIFAMFGVIASRLAEAEINLQGMTKSGIYRQIGLTFDSNIEPGFYLALAAGALLVILAPAGLFIMRRQSHSSLRKSSPP